MAPVTLKQQAKFPALPSDPGWRRLPLSYMGDAVYYHAKRRECAIEHGERLVEAPPYVDLLVAHLRRALR